MPAFECPHPAPRRRFLALALAAAALLGAPPPAAAGADAIVGAWLTDGGASKVEIAASQAGDGSTVYGGKVVWLKEPTRDGKPVVDANNADPAQRGRPILGLPILQGFKAAGGVWTGGTVYAPRAGKSYPAELSIAPDGRLELKVQAGLLSRTDHWTRP
jgi:uncharacterized protein (DUF2147 family)